MARRRWEIPEREATPEDVYINRRKFLRTLGFTGLGVAGWLSGCSNHSETAKSTRDVASIIGPVNALSAEPSSPLAPRNPDFDELYRLLTLESDAAIYNNFIEFSLDKDVWQWVDLFRTDPWTVEVVGLVNRPKIYDLDELVSQMPLEERLYRHRCVEAWSMAVPWTGFPFKALIDTVEPLASARYVELTSFFDPEEAPIQKSDPALPWAYIEGLTLEEASNELTLLATGMYGHELLKQHGAPIRLVAPWKYGFKSIKSVVRIEFKSERPTTFWNLLVPSEYGFEANVDPEVPHPRWSQKKERMLGSNEVQLTLPYNGYKVVAAVGTRIIA
jgi:sulfoxide reductase catalytic subunit YedY